MRRWRIAKRTRVERVRVLFRHEDIALVFKHFGALGYRSGSGGPRERRSRGQLDPQRWWMIFERAINS